MRFAGWTLCLNRCNSGLPLDTELRTMTHRQQAAAAEEALQAAVEASQAAVEASDRKSVV